MHQRSTGSAALATVCADGVIRISDLYQQGCAKLRFPKNHDRRDLEAVMINTAGGIAGGDGLGWRFEAGRDCTLTVTSQACERLYRALEESARIRIELTAQDGSRLNWLPQETILFDRCRVHRRIDATLGDDARLLVVEPLLFGRTAMGETVRQGMFRDAWHIRHGEKCIHADILRFDGQIKALLDKRAVTGGAAAVASILAIDTGGPHRLESLLEPARKVVGEAGGASFWQIDETGKLLARLVAKDGYTLRRTLVPLVELLNDGATLPKSWAL